MKRVPIDRTIFFLLPGKEVEEGLINAEKLKELKFNEISRWNFKTLFDWMRKDQK